jgi:hypothetical protein
MGMCRYLRTALIIRPEPITAQLNFPLFQPVNIILLTVRSYFFRGGHIGVN